MDPNKEQKIERLHSSNSITTEKVDLQDCQPAPHEHSDVNLHGASQSSAPWQRQ